MKHLVIGMGEVGTALAAILGSYTHTLDAKNSKEPFREGPYEVVHICFPYSSIFLAEVEGYKKRFNPQVLIIHSSVPVGTSDKLGAVYSPVRGVHPDLALGMRTITKYFAGLKAGKAASYFSTLGIPVRVLSDTRTLEAAKLWDTTVYGLSILLEKEMWAYARENGLDFEIMYREFTATYNMGYSKLGMPHVVRPWLMHADGKIGGHCVLENAALLDSPSAKRLIKENKKL